VAYGPNVVPIWEGVRDYFREAGVPTDYVLYSSYKALVEALFERHVDIAWNTNVAYVRCEQRAEGRCQVLGMRNTDLGFTSRMIARADSGIAGLKDLRGKRVALGSADSAQAAIMPLYFMRQAGLDPDRDTRLVRYNVDVGKHGDTGDSEMNILKALHEGAADAGFLGHTTWLKVMENGQVDGSRVRSVWTSPGYSHCVFTALPDFDPAVGRRWTDTLLRMDYTDARWRRIMDLEGLTQWVPGQKDGYAPVMAAMQRQAGLR
jgi:ABC-type phosphate/phosphonate transport system substrate-binding protein